MGPDRIALERAQLAVDVRERLELGRLPALTITTRNGVPVPLSQIARLHYEFEEPILWRKSRELTLTVRAGTPLGEIADARPRGTWRCVLDSLLRRRPEIHYRGPDPGDFRTVVLVSPIWMYRLAGPMRTFVQREKDAIRRVAVISTMNSGGASNALAEIATAAEFDHVVVNDDLDAAVEDVNAVLEGRPGAMRPHPPLERMTDEVRAEIERHLGASA